MSQLAPPKPRAVKTAGSFAIVASQFNQHYVDGLVDHCLNELRARSPGAKVSVHRVPGAFEIPIVVREIALGRKAKAIIALGVILQGDTAHAEHLGRAVTDALQRLALEYGVPVINAVLSLTTDTQARQRCLGEKINRGTEAARAALEIVDVLAKVRK